MKHASPWYRKASTAVGGRRPLHAHSNCVIQNRERWTKAAVLDMLDVSALNGDVFYLLNLGIPRIGPFRNRAKLYQ